MNLSAETIERLENQTVDLPTIELNKKELTLLELLNKDCILETDDNFRAASRLVTLFFISRIKVDSTDKDKQVLFYQIKQRGQNYLMYRKGVVIQRRKESVRYWITTTIAVAAFIKSFFF